MQFELLDRNGDLIGSIDEASSHGNCARHWARGSESRSAKGLLNGWYLSTSVGASFEVYEASASRFVDAEHDDAAGIAAVRGAAFLGK